MADFKVVLSDPQDGLSYKVEATGGMAGAFMGKSVGDIISGDALGFPGYQIAITGATDKTGIPARKDLPGLGRRKILLANGVGFKPTYHGQRRRMSVRSAEINGDFVQINAKVVEYGEKSLKDYFAPAEEAEAAE